MTSADPPRLATWMLQHLASGGRDEALEGDLLECFRTGRSNGWYWRQSLTACLVSWGSAFQARLPLVFFALAWSMLAPAWILLCDYAESSRIALNLPSVFGILWVLVALIGWTILHAAFVWIGMLVYSAAHGTLGTPLRNKKVSRGLLIAPIVLVVVQAVMFFWGAIYRESIPSLSAHLSATAIGRITDIRLLPDLMRIPYFIALVAALWGTIVESPRLRNMEARSDDSAELLPSTTRFVLVLVAAGSMNAVLFGFLLCRLPEFHASSLASLLIRALASVGFGVLGGVAGTWLYWKSPWSPYHDETPFSPGLVMLACASAWVWAPACALFADQLSAAMAIAAAIGSYLLLAGLRDAAPLLLPNVVTARHVPAGEPSLFADVLASRGFPLHGYLIALTLYAGCAAIFAGANHTAAVMLALSAAVFAWMRPAPTHSSASDQGRTFRRFAIRLGVASLAAVLATAWALLDEDHHHSQIISASVTPVVNPPGNAGRESTTANSAYRGVGYESLILYPFPEKQKIVAPVLSRVSLLAPGTTTPVTVRFTGTYRYVQPPSKHPGPHAHHAFGTPLDASIESNDSSPLVMDAHQELATRIPTDRCRSIQVDVANSDNIAGPISVALLLSDDASGNAQSLYLGQQVIASAQASGFSIKSRPVSETLSFPVPNQPRLRKFNEITAVFLSGSEHSLVAPKVAIQAFRLIPR